MGCGASNNAANAPQSKEEAKPTAPVKEQPKDTKKDEKKEEGGGGSGVPENLTKGLADMPALVAAIKDKDKEDRVCAYSEDKSLRVTVWDSKGNIYSTTCSEQGLLDNKDAKGVSNWTTFFTSLVNQFTSKQLKIRVSSSSKCTVSFSVAEPKKVNFTFTLESIGNELKNVHKYFFHPLVGCWAGNGPKGKPDDKFMASMQAVFAARAKATGLEEQVTAMQNELQPLKDTTTTKQQAALQAQQKIRTIERKIQFVKSGGLPERYFTDWPQGFQQHSPHSLGHSPVPKEPNRIAMQQLKVNYLKDDHDYVAKESPAPPLGPAETELQSLLSAAPDDTHNAIVSALKAVDEWEFDTFTLAEATKGAPLFIISYALFFKYGLIHHYKMDEDVVVNFLLAMESMYHAVPFSNSTHAADVVHAMSYIMRIGKMVDTLKLGPADTLSCLLAAMVIDLDHPGLNGNFHARTLSYLSVLYNDRATLEYHAAATWACICKESKFNIFSSLTDPDFRTTRDNVLEMVINTDRGNIVRYTNLFKKKQADENVDWTINKREEARMAMSIALNMADTAYVARKTETYCKWAMLKADEDYNQGAIEQRLGLAVSPFMLKNNHPTHFVRSQQLLSEKIVTPLWEAGSALFSGMAPIVAHIKENMKGLEKPDVLAMCGL